MISYTYIILDHLKNRKMSFIRLVIVLAVFSFGLSVSAQTTIAPSVGQESQIEFRAVAELGFLAVADHKIQFSNSGTYFDYRRDGGQDVLFPVSRLSLEVDFNKRNTIVLLYQPLRIESQALLLDDLVVDELTYPANTSVEFLYNFPFYRFSYLRELLPNNQKYSLGIGGTIQIRNATISFESADGMLYRANRDIGIVPALKLRGQANVNERVFIGFEADGIYAPVSYLNGSDNEVVGAILDASVRAGLHLSDEVNTFLNLRYLGGGAVGTSDDDERPGDGYVKNWLHFLTVSAGFVYNF
jgi:hypothetical protein